MVCQPVLGVYLKTLGKDYADFYQQVVSVCEIILMITVLIERLCSRHIEYNIDSILTEASFPFFFILREKLPLQKARTLPWNTRRVNSLDQRGMRFITYLFAISVGLASAQFSTFYFVFYNFKISLC